LSKVSSPHPVLTGLGIPAEPGSLYETALTHRSYAFEQSVPVPHNERLEFLGDAVLEAVVTDLIFRTYPEMPEGEMARLRASVVERQALASLAEEAGVGAHLRLGRGEEASGGRTKASLLADALEALVGALYLDRGIETVAAVLEPVFADMIERAVTAGTHDAKGALQETAARMGAERPAYRVAGSGPDHDRRFVAHVYVDEELFGVGTGTSKREAETNAAREALSRLMEGADEGDRDARAS
jgi:ribonuclease III